MVQAVPRTVELWARLLRGHAAMRRVLGERLQLDHGLNVTQYTALLLLSQADGHRMRRIDLADGLQLSPSGVTRLLDGLHHVGLVENGNSRRDARVTYAVLTDDGDTKLEEVLLSYRRDVLWVFADRYSDRELETLIELLGRLTRAETDRRSEATCG